MIDSFYNTQRWRRLSARIMRRDKFLCRDCARYGRNTPAQVVHHIKPREIWPELQWDPSNLVALCERCHNKRHPEKGGVRRAAPQRE